MGVWHAQQGRPLRFRQVTLLVLSVIRMQWGAVQQMPVRAKRATTGLHLLVLVQLVLLALTRLRLGMVLFLWYAMHATLVSQQLQSVKIRPAAYVLQDTEATLQRAV